MSYDPISGDVSYFQFDDGVTLTHRRHLMNAQGGSWHVYCAGPTPHEWWLKVFGDQDDAVHWLRCRGLARRLVRTGTYDGREWSYSPAEDAPAPA